MLASLPSTRQTSTGEPKQATFYRNKKLEEAKKITSELADELQMLNEQVDLIEQMVKQEEEETEILTHLLNYSERNF